MISEVRNNRRRKLLVARIPWAEFTELSNSALGVINYASGFLCGTWTEEDAMSFVRGCAQTGAIFNWVNCGKVIMSELLLWAFEGNRDAAERMVYWHSNKWQGWYK